MRVSRRKYSPPPPAWSPAPLFWTPPPALLDLIEQRLVDDRIMFALEALILMHDPSKIDLVAEQVEQRSSAERRAADDFAFESLAPFGMDRSFDKFALKRMDRSKFEIERKDRANGLGLKLIDQQFMRTFLGPVIAQR